MRKPILTALTVIMFLIVLTVQTAQSEPPDIVGPPPLPVYVGPPPMPPAPARPVLPPPYYPDMRPVILDFGPPPPPIFDPPPPVPVPPPLPLIPVIAPPPVLPPVTISIPPVLPIPLDPVIHPNAPVLHPGGPLPSGPWSGMHLAPRPGQLGSIRGPGVKHPH
ncbi:hypothetical protein ASN18_0066 [Candidatus Magnetominusculus xianensis]|uniref:Secreted protein n=2 Tax=Candidatus Magnetominusculus xianensis TaxID=1748249 RepID=A0ABR5SJZ8_9BACT|nr:hypothetical protein ASN18_0066 [Candidatus Magnetominusculus xianensis]